MLILHFVAVEDSDDEGSNTNATNPFSPTSNSYKSRFNFGSNARTSDSTGGSDNADRFANRRTSRSGYTYRTREKSPEEEPAGNCLLPFCPKRILNFKD